MYLRRFVSSCPTVTPQVLRMKSLSFVKKNFHVFLAHPIFHLFSIIFDSGFVYRVFDLSLV